MTIRRRGAISAWVLGVAGVVVLGGGLLANWITATPVHWGLLVVIAGAVLVILAVYLWIRLSE